jgi:hypothetical protein
MELSEHSLIGPPGSVTLRRALQYFMYTGVSPLVASA